MRPSLVNSYRACPSSKNRGGRSSSQSTWSSSSLERNNNVACEYMCGLIIDFSSVGSSIGVGCPCGARDWAGYGMNVRCCCSCMLSFFHCEKGTVDSARSFARRCPKSSVSKEVNVGFLSSADTGLCLSKFEVLLQFSLTFSEAKLILFFLFCGSVGAGSCRRLRNG